MKVGTCGPPYDCTLATTWGGAVGKIVIYGRQVALALLQMTRCGSRAFLFTTAITVVSMSEFNLLKSSHFLNSFELLGN